MKALSRLLNMTILLPVLAGSAIGCGRETKIYPDQQVEQAAAPTVAIRDGRSVLPEDFFDQSANRAAVDIALDGTGAETLALRFKTQSGTNDAGGFNGAGVGNRAILGLGAFNAQKLSSFSGVTFDSKSIAGSEGISVLLLADLNCDGSAPRVLIADSTSLGAGTAVASGYTRKEAAFSEVVWKVSGAAITDPGDASITLVPSSSGGTAASLTALIAKHPNVCLKNAASGDDDLPKNLPTGSILFALGSSATTTLNTVFVNRLTVGTETFEELE